MLAALCRGEQELQTCVDQDAESRIEGDAENNEPKCFKIASGPNTEVTAETQGQDEPTKLKEGKQALRLSEATRQTTANHRLHPANVLRSAKHRANQGRIHQAVDSIQA